MSTRKMIIFPLCLSTHYIIPVQVIVSPGLTCVSCDSAAMDTDKKIPLPNFLKLLTNNNVSTPKAMAVAGKMLSKFLHHLATCVV